MSDNHSNIGSENNEMSKSVDKPIFRLGQTGETPVGLAKGSLPLNVSKSVMITT